MLPRNGTIYTAEDYWALPKEERAELIDGQLYTISQPNLRHQRLVMALSATIRNYIKAHNGSCEVLPAPFAVNLNADDKTYVEPDISVICDKNKHTERGCSGAPDFIIEIVSPSSRKMDYLIKVNKYQEAGVREYWIVDPTKKRTTIYRFDAEDVTPVIAAFTDALKVGVFEVLVITVAELLE